MKILWLCNIMLPRICESLGREGSKKEGWISGLFEEILALPQKNIEISLAFPMEKDFFKEGETWKKQVLSVPGTEKSFTYYAFCENTQSPWIYEVQLEKVFQEIFAEAEVDLLHSFGTEYPHTLAAVKAFGKPEQTLLGIQGLCSVYADAYYANLPEKVKKGVTFRDLVKADTLTQQQEKFVLRGQYEKEAIALAGHIAGRTHWDRKYTEVFHKEAKYHVLHETLRKEFYEGEWQYEKCEKHHIFVSQGNYPIKGLHYVLLALPKILEKYPDTKVSVAGDCILRYGLMGKLKISAYGQYLMDLIKANHLEGKISFLGGLDAKQMKEQYLKSHIYLCPSSIENSPNSLGEAMLLKTPVVTADVGGIASMISSENCYLYQGFREEKEGELERISLALAEQVLQAFGDEEKVSVKTGKAREQGLNNHNPEENVQELLSVYETIMAGNSQIIKNSQIIN